MADREVLIYMFNKGVEFQKQKAENEALKSKCRMVDKQNYQHYITINYGESSHIILNPRMTIQDMDRFEKELEEAGIDVKNATVPYLELRKAVEYFTELKQ